MELDRIPLTPGERAEVVVTFRPGEDVVLRSFARGSGAGFFSDRFSGFDDDFDVLQFRAAERLEPSPDVADRLADVERLDPDDAMSTRSFRLSGTRINGEDMDMARIDEAVTAGTTEIWQLHNEGGTPHNFHVHGVRFQVLDIDGEPPPARLRGWKDTVETRSGETVRLIVRFGSHTDADTPYMYHCHILAHEDSGMMGQFVVVEPGEAAGSPPSGEHHEHD